MDEDDGHRSTPHIAMATSAFNLLDFLHSNHKEMEWILLKFVLLFQLLGANAWVTRSDAFRIRQATTQLLLAPEDYQDRGNQLIRQAAIDCGCVNPEEDLTVEWKPDKIIVTLSTTGYVGDLDEEEAEEIFDEKDDGIDDVGEATGPISGVDVTALARAINAAFGQDEAAGQWIAETHEIEVTTPGASDELVGAIMFEAYKGFDVICQQQDLKTKNIKKVEGRLVERNDEFTIVNIKGRIKKMKNNTVLSVRLPKAKKEKTGGGNKKKTRRK